MAKSGQGAQKKDGYHHGDLARTALLSAIEMVRESGLEAFSLRAVARRVGVDPAALYRHFSNKEAILGAVAREGFKGMAEAMESALESCPPPGPKASAKDQARRHSLRFRTLGRAYVEFAVEYPEIFRLMFGPFGAGSSAGPQAVRGAGAGGMSPYEMLEAALEELSAAGLAAKGRSTGASILMAWSAVHGLASLAISGVLRLEEDEFSAAIDRITDDVLRAIRAS